MKVENERRAEEKVHSPSLHWRCALARASPANLEWGTMRCNESMRDHNHRICCCLNCSVSYWKNAHRCHVRYLMPAMTMMSMTLCTTRGWVLVPDDCSRCDRRGMKALKATLSPFLYRLLLLRLVAFFSPMIMTMTCLDDEEEEWKSNSSGGRKSIFLLFRFVWLLLVVLYLQPANKTWRSGNWISSGLSPAKDENAN